MIKPLTPGISCLMICGFLLSSAHAHHTGFQCGSGVSGPVNTVSATTLPRSDIFVAYRSLFTAFDPFTDAQLKTAAQEGKEIHSIDYLWAQFLIAGYGLSDNCTVGVYLPYIMRNNLREGHIDDGSSAVHNHGDPRGLGDTGLFSEYRFLHQERSGIEAALLLGLKCPTGQTHVEDPEGERLSTEHQPGSGSWDPSVGIACTRRLSNISLDFNVLYTIATNGAQETNLGDILNYNASFSYCLYQDEKHHDEDHHAPVCNLVLEANGEWHQKQTIDRITDTNSGGDIVYLTPGIVFDLEKEWLFSFSVGIPVFQQLNGVQSKADANYIVGLSKGF
jgi:hypothetical protein